LQHKEITMPRIAVVQQPPLLLHRDATLERACAAIAEAAAGGAALVVLPECFVPGYPSWIWRLAAGRDASAMGALHARLQAAAVDIDAGDLEALAHAARRHRVSVVCGVNERERTAGAGTLYNSVVVLGPDGALLNRHRKLMPTNPERMVHGSGDARGLRVVDTPVGRLGVLICWENYMPLARYALYAQGIEVYVAPTYDAGDGWLATLRHIALEGRCWVVGSGCALRASDLPDDFPDRDTLYPDPDAWINDGDSAVFDPQGRPVAGPLRRETGLLYAAIDATRVAAARRTLDVAGHYARPDVFTLHVNRAAASPVRWHDDATEGEHP
jgi:nitrilase